MTVSILVPVYGVEKYIERCAVSLFDQTYDDIEYIFVNDCTPDKSVTVLREVVERYPVRKPRVRIIDHDRNRGVGTARRTLMDAATGEWVMFVDSDDRMPQDAVEKLVRRIENTGADIAEGAYCEASVKGNSKPMRFYKSESDRTYLRRFLAQAGVRNNLWARIYRRCFITQSAIEFIPGVDYAEDYSFLARLLFRARRTTIDDVVYYYDIDHTTFFTNRVFPEKHLRSYIAASKLIYNYYLANDPKGEMLTPLQFAMTRMLSEARRNGSKELMSETAFYRPQGLMFKLLAWMFRSSLPHGLAHFTYLSARKMLI